MTKSGSLVARVCWLVYCPDFHDTRGYGTLFSCPSVTLWAKLRELQQNSTTSHDGANDPKQNNIRCQRPSWLRQVDSRNLRLSAIRNPVS